MRALGCVLVFALLVVPASAHADAPEQPPTASDFDREASRSAFRRGVALLQRGDFIAARSEFEEAYRLFPHPSILLNLGTTRAKTGEYVRAEEDLLKFLADDGGAPPEEVQGARETLAQVRSHLGTFKLLVDPPGARAKLDGTLSLALAPGEAAPVRTSAGAHKLTVEADGYAPRELDIDVSSTDVRVVEVRLRPASATPPPDRGRTQRTAGWITIGAGGAFAVFGIVAGAYALSLADAYNTRGTSDFQSADVRASGMTFRTLADVSFVTAVACVGAGIALVLTSPKTAVTANASGVWLAGRF